MGTLSQHEAKADSNQKFIDSIQLLGFSDWTATAIFYRAVHLVEMMFAVNFLEKALVLSRLLHDGVIPNRVFGGNSRAGDPPISTKASLSGSPIMPSLKANR